MNSSDGPALTDHGGMTDRTPRLETPEEITSAIRDAIVDLERDPTDMAATNVLLTASLAAAPSGPHADAIKNILLEFTDLEFDGPLGAKIVTLLHQLGQARTGYLIAKNLLLRFPGEEAVLQANLTFRIHFGDFEDIRSLHEGLITKSGSYEYYRPYILALLASSRFDDVKECVTALRADGTADPRLLLLIALCDIRQGGLEKASAEIRSAVELGAAPRLELMSVARSLASAEPAQLATELLDFLASSFPTVGELAVLSARRQFDQGLHEAARGSLEHALTFGPDEDLLLRLGRTQIALGDIDGAQATAARLRKEFARGLNAEALQVEISRATGDEQKAERIASELHNRLFKWISVDREAFSTPKILGIIDSDAMGDFAMQLMLLATIKRQFKQATLTLLFHDNLPFKSAFIRACPEVDEATDFAGQPFSIPTTQGGRKRKGKARFPYDFIVPQTALRPERLPGFGNGAVMRVHPEDRDRLAEDLAGYGVEPGRWFATMHYRQGATFPRRKAHKLRDVDPKTFHQMADYICGELGGQVVRIGHPGMDPMPSTKGYIDLSAAPLDLQIFAVSKSRYLLATDSGPVALGSALNVPTIKSNTIYEVGVWRPHDIMLLKNIINWQGEVLEFGDSLIDRFIRLTKLSNNATFDVVDNTVDQLRHCVDIIHARTKDIGEWRADLPPVDIEAPDELRWRTPGRRGAELIELPRLLNRPIRKIQPG